MQGKLTILLTNIAFAFRSGTEIVVDQVARGLLRRGHRPVVFAPYVDGDIASDLRMSGIAVINRLGSGGIEPDIIQGQHNVTTVMALAAFPTARALFWCHDFSAPKDQPPLVPRIRRFLAVDDACRDRLLLDGAPPERVVTVYNAVDLERFMPRAPLPERPARLLCLTKGNDHIQAVRTAAASAGLEVEVLGGGVGQVVNDLPDRLVHYDIVVATARMALEAAAAGCAVIVCDHRGFAGMLTLANLDAWRSLNFGRRLLQYPVTQDTLVAAIGKYDASNAARVTSAIRAQAGLEGQLDQLEALYREILAERYVVDSQSDLRALAPFLEDFLISRDFNRPWAALYTNVTDKTIEYPGHELLRQIEALNATLSKQFAVNNPLRRYLSFFSRNHNG